MAAGGTEAAMAGTAGTPSRSQQPDGPTPQVGIGVVAPYDMALDREMWRWTPPDVSLLFTRTPYAPVPVSIEMAELVSDAPTIQNGIRDLQAVCPSAYAYACTSGSFVNGLAGERALIAAMRDAGAPAAVTASGALLAALCGLGATRVAVATPYVADVTARLARYFQEADLAVVGSAHLDLAADIWAVPYGRTADLIRAANTPRAEAIVVSCTNLPTYDLIAPLEHELGKPVISANQATIWAALAAVGHRLVGPGQRLADLEVAL